jgi:hypothetical protein
MNRLASAQVMSRLHFVEQLSAQIVLFKQMAEPAHRGLVGHRLAAEVDPDKTLANRGAPPPPPGLTG